MRRDWRSVPASDGYLSETQRRAEERQKKLLIERAMQQSGYLRRKRMEEAEERAEDLILEGLLYRMDRELDRLISIRDAHTPKRAEDNWDDVFCYAVSRIPAVRRMRDDLYFACMVTGKPELYIYG